MGLSSNARLLTITARLTSNEYETQQISNAKMRLATQSQQASEDYIHALNQDSYSFVTYDSFGNPVNTGLTANVLFQYGDQKNQYVLANSSGQALINQSDAKKFEQSGTLYEFLKKYGIEAKMDEDLKDLYDKVNSYILPSGRNKWDDFVNKMMYNPQTVELKFPDDRNYNATAKEWNLEYPTDDNSNVIDVYTYWLNNKDAARENYYTQKAFYQDTIDRFELDEKDDKGNEITRTYIEREKDKLDENLKVFSRMVNFGAFLEFQYYDEYQQPRVYSSNDGGEKVKAFHEYKENLAKLNSELEKRGIDIDDAVTYEDSTKAQWYTNLWYRLNGNSTLKSMSANNNYKVLESELASSDTWIKDSLNQGIITIEQASYINTDNTIADDDNPLVMKLNGIKWTTKMFGNCPDIIQKDDNSKLAKAEAAYEKKTAEINAKDEKLQRQIDLLNSEHNALQTEYDSVKSALEKNITRSFKTFNG